jgi:hypothetical protein
MGKATRELHRAMQTHPTRCGGPSTIQCPRHSDAAKRRAKKREQRKTNAAKFR